eukprot:3644184-Rhodomonas_salina.1
MVAASAGYDADTPYTVHPTPCTLHPTPFTLHPTPSTLYPRLSSTLDPTPTLHPPPYTLDRHYGCERMLLCTAAAHCCVAERDATSSHPILCDVTSPSYPGLSLILSSAT